MIAAPAPPALHRGGDAARGKGLPPPEAGRPCGAREGPASPPLPLGRSGSLLGRSSPAADYRPIEATGDAFTGRAKLRGP